jgi:hypothetical protein
MSDKQDTQAPAQSAEPRRGLGFVTGTITTFGGSAMMIWFIHWIISRVAPADSNDSMTFTLWLILVVAPQIIVGWLHAYGPRRMRRRPSNLSGIPARYFSMGPKDLMIYSIVLGVSVMMILYGVGRIVDSESYFRGGLAIALGEAGLVMFCRKVVAVLTSVGSNIAAKYVLPTSGAPLNARFQSGPMSPTEQHFNWSETIYFNPLLGPQ